MEELQNICLLTSNKAVSNDITFYIGKQFCICYINKFNNILSLVRIKTISGIIFYIDESLLQSDKNLINFKKNFPTIPFIGITPDLNIETARKCGEIGFNRLYCKSQIKQLADEIKAVIIPFNIRINIKDLHIDFDKCTDLAKRILKYIEKNYINIVNNQDIIDGISVSEVKLNNELKENKLPSLRRIVLFFKINHSIQLMRNNGLNLTEIAELSGFTNNKRFGECFIRVFNMTPKTYRNKLKNCTNENRYCGQWN